MIVLTLIDLIYIGTKCDFETNDVKLSVIENCYSWAL